jgi:hypothetical protein
VPDLAQHRTSDDTRDQLREHDLLRREHGGQPIKVYQLVEIVRPRTPCDPYYLHLKYY